MSNRQSRFDVQMHMIDAFECEPDNSDRAAFVAPLVRCFATAYYWGNEEIETIVGDLIADLGHFLDRFEQGDFGDNVLRSDSYTRGAGDGMEVDDAFYGLVMHAWHMYDEEVDLEVAEQ